ncbi:MAG: hypothetical protein ACYC3G_03250 [Minisyncoccota bacterium]
MKKKIKKSVKKFAATKAKAGKKVVKKVKKAAKKVTKKVKKIKKAAKKAVKVMPKRKPIGEVTHFFDKICVAVVKFNEGVAVGEELCFEGPKESFNQVLNSMQYEHESIPKAKKGQEVGVKTKKPVREGHKVYRV